jgi:hypothetical protein
MPGGIHPPLEVIASWPTPNYTNPVTRGWDIVILDAILLAFAFVVLLARLWARLGLQHNAGLDDVFIVAAFVGVLNFAIDALAG